MAEKKEKGLQARERALIKCGIGALVLIVGYLAGSQLIAPKTAEISKNVIVLTKEVAELEQANKRKVEIQKELEKMQNDTETIIGKYPSNFTFEKLTEFITATMNEKFKFALDEISYADNGEFYTFTDSSGAENSGSGKISSATVTVSYSTSYEVLKNIIKFINEDISTRATINELSIEANKEGAVTAVEGEISFVVYYGMSQNKYKEPEFDVNVGKKEIFSKK